MRPDKQALATISAGAKAAYIIKEPVAAAIGADIPIGSASGHMIIDIGGGTAEMAVISLGGIVASTSVRVRGNKFDTAILEFVRRKYNLAVGERTAEDIKIKAGKLGKTHPGALWPIGQSEVLLENGPPSRPLLETGDRILLEG